ncbi:MAG: DNA mismatch repair protein MutS, partial [Candidatus Eisenbacteria bacterium]|nr:DNA mismatch repair protein MutS [Candidatus Eisenbacteria bacterium]
MGPEPRRAGRNAGRSLDHTRAEGGGCSSLTPARLHDPDPGPASPARRTKAAPRSMNGAHHGTGAARTAGTSLADAMSRPSPSQSRNSRAPRRKEPAATPMMAQYHEIKAQYPDAILLYRMGDFYEMFYDDARTASRLLGLTLTSRDKGQDGGIPLAGIPWHSATPYIDRLLKAGHKIAICEQVSDTPGKSGLMERKVVEVLTPGTALEEGLLESRTNNFVAAVRWTPAGIGLAAADISTGEFLAGEAGSEEILAQLLRFQPAELVIGDDQAEMPAVENLVQECGSPYVSRVDAWRFEPHRGREALCRRFKLATLDGWDLEDTPAGVGAAAALMEYASEQKQSPLEHIQRITRLRTGATMVLDGITLRHLEILEPLLGSDRSTTLIGVLDATQTAMGGRALRAALRAPLMDLAAIRRRHAVIGALADDPPRLESLRGILAGIRDIERILGKVTTERATPRDLGALRDSLEQFPKLRATVRETAGEDAPARELDILDDLHEMLRAALTGDPPNTAGELGIIREGYDADLDAIRQGAASGRQWIASLQESERTATGIPTLKVGFNKVFGYYLEVTRPHLAKVPASYIRKQTLVNAERFVTPELKEQEEKVLGAEDAEKRRQKEILRSLLLEVSSRAARLSAAASDVAELDLLAGWADVARRGGYIRPQMSPAAEIRIEEGRHPVVETFVGAGRFVANDIDLDTGERQIQILTGPNMAGKSTFLRQVGLLCVMAQAGCWVPAKAARMGTVERIFTRVGASDNIALGQSTFLVEMVETSRILNQATSRSLVLLDEIGRGTSTYDGLALAWAVAEELRRDPERRPMVIFATHFHEMTRLARQSDGFLNLNVEVREWNNEVVFLRKVSEGAADRSYGVQVARLAGVPRHVLQRAQQLLADLEARGPRPVPGGGALQPP